MATIQPVYGPDYQKILLQGLQTYSNIKGMQRADAQEERAALQQQQNTDREVRINELSTRALTDPQAMAQLQLIAPQKWTQIQEAKKYQREEETYRQQQEEKDAVEAQKAIDRMHEERANLWKSAKGKPLFMQKELIKEHVQRINDRGGDATQSQNLLNMLNSDDPAKIKEAQQVFDSGGQESEKQLTRSRQAKEGGLIPGTEEYNQYILTGDASFLYPEKEELGKGTALMQNVEFLRTLKPGSEEYKMVKSAISKDKDSAIPIQKKIEYLNTLTPGSRDYKLVEASLLGKQETLEISPDGTVTIKSGLGVGPDLTKKTKGNLEGQIVNFESSIEKLNRLDEQYKPEFLTWKGQGKALWSSVKSKAGLNLSPEEKEFTQKRKAFTQNVNQFFNDYRREITGAAASVQELESLKKAIFNEDLSPVEFEAAFGEFKDGVYRSKRIIRKLLREGVAGSLKDKKSEASKRFNAEFTGGGDDRVIDRVQDLLKDKVSDEEAQRILESEGYI